MTDLCLTQTDLQIQHNSKSSPHRAPGGNPDPKDLITLLYGRASKTLLEKGHSVPQTECWTRWGIGFSRPSPQYVGDKDIWQQNPKRTQSLHLITQMSKELQRTQNHRSPIKMSRSLSPGREGTRQDTRSRPAHLPPASSSCSPLGLGLPRCKVHFLGPTPGDPWSHSAPPRCQHLLGL